LSPPETAPALVATLHDPAGAALPLLERAGPALAHYPVVAVAATSGTDPRVTRRLRAIGARVVTGGQTGESRRASLAAAGGDCAAYLSCDFDRWLHWACFWPQELIGLPRRVARLGSGARPAPWYVCLGRTARAFRTHPATQRLPETASNLALSQVTGAPLDAVAGAAWLTPEAATIILAASREVTAATDLEWPALIIRQAPSRLRGLRCEGLEWETPDFHPDAVAAAGGLAAWTHSVYDTPAAWAERLRLAGDEAAALARVLCADTDPR
jgi:hypothetical protein